MIFHNFVSIINYNYYFEYIYINIDDGIDTQNRIQSFRYIHQMSNLQHTHDHLHLQKTKKWIAIFVSLDISSIERRIEFTVVYHFTIFGQKPHFNFVFVLFVFCLFFSHNMG